MFDFGFSKLLLLGIVALVVIGPERLPKVARTMGHLYGRLQRYVTQVKSDINREMEAADLGNMKAEFETAARSFQSEVESSVRSVDQEVRATQASIERALDVAAPAADEAAAPATGALPAPEAAAPQLELGIEEPEQPASRDRAQG
jgi:sec-independent protein translocase protein TatB